MYLTCVRLFFFLLFHLCFFSLARRVSIMCSGVYVCFGRLGKHSCGFSFVSHTHSRSSFTSSRTFYNSTNSVATWLSIFFGGISMLSKETGITVLLLNLTYDLYRCWPSLKRTVVDVHWSPETQHCYRRLSKLLLSMGILLVVRLALLQGSFPKFSQQDNPTAYHPSLYVR